MILGGEGSEEIQKKRRTIPLSKHHCLRTNVLFQKIGTNFTHTRTSKKTGTIKLSNIGTVTQQTTDARRAEAREASEGWWAVTGSNRRPYRCKEAQPLPYWFTRC